MSDLRNLNFDSMTAAEFEQHLPELFASGEGGKLSEDPRLAKFLKANPDCSIDLYLQHDSPGADKEANWLPAPAGKFILMLRMYWPSEGDPSILDGSSTIPGARKVPS